MAISATKRKQCKLNAKKSTGPRTTAGKHAVRYNAVKHAGSAKMPVLPWEDRAAFDELVVSYKNWMQPVGEIEVALVDQAALASWQYARATRSDVARVTFNIQTARANEQREAAESAAALGQRLFFEQHGPLALHPRPDSAAFGERTVWSKTPDDPDHPSRLVMSLEATFAGVMWLLARWSELRSRLEGGECWHAPEKLKALRLLGKLSCDAADDRDVSDIYLCCYVLDPKQQDDPFFEVRFDMEPADYKQFRERLVRRQVELRRPSDPITARVNLLALVERKMDRLSMLSDQRLAFDDAMNALKTDIMGFDDSVEGERLRRHIAASDRALHRAIATIIKMRKDLETPEFGPAESATAERAAASGESGIENTAEVDTRRAEIETPDLGGTQTMDDDRNLQNGCAENCRTSDLQNKPTAAGDEPQFQSPDDVREPRNAADNDADFGPRDEPTAAIREQHDPTQNLPEAGGRNGENGSPEGDGHLARQQPISPANSEEDGHLARQQPVSPANSEGDGHLVRQQPVPAASAAESSIPDHEEDVPMFQNGCADGVRAGELQNKATGAGDEPQVQFPEAGQEQKDAPDCDADFGLEDKPTAAIRAEDDPTETACENAGRNRENGPSEGDGRPAGQQPVFSASSEGDGRPAGQHQVVPANANERQGPSSSDQTRNRDNDAFTDILADPEREVPILSSGQTLSGGLRGQLVRELRRRELKQNQKDGFHRPDRHARRARGSRNTQDIRKPRAIEIPGDFPILASLPPRDFSRVLADVHHELEEELM
jgi:hypothetical protein